MRLWRIKVPGFLVSLSGAVSTCACVPTYASFGTSNANFTIWNPPASFTHVAEAPLFFAGQGFTSTIYLTNTSGNAVVVELDPHLPNGNATQNLPYQVALNAGASATVDAASLYTIGTDPENSSFSAQINGGIRLRHNGSQDSDVRAVLVVERGCGEQFTTPFTYAASSLSASGTMQCSPMYYVDAGMNTYVSLQNITNSPQTVELTCNYGTGATGTPNGKVQTPLMVLGPQQTKIVDLRSIMSSFGGAEWGSMEVFTTTPRSVVCHSAMMSIGSGMSWDCPFVDPAMCVSTTKVAEKLTLDYSTAENAYIMVCNTSATDSRTVTASFKTTTGVTIPSTQVTIAPGGQQMITLSAQQLLSAGGNTIADVRLTYSGNASDIVAAGCSMQGAYPTRTNVALAANGAIATASSTYSTAYGPSGVIDGDRKGTNWGNGGGWNDGTVNSYPDWIQVSFNGSKTLNEIDVFTLQDTLSNPSEPTETMTFSQYGIVDFQVQYWNGSSWLAVPGGSVTGNNKVWRKFLFSNVTTDKIRVYVTNALASYSRVTEIEAWGASDAGRAVGLKFKEPSAGDGRRLTSPYFRFDENISGRVLVSNLGSSSILVGARMVLANSTALPIKSPAVTIPAGGVGIIDLSSVGDRIPDGVIASGRVDLIHSGAPGTVTAAVAESGCYNSGQVVPLDGGPPIDPLTLFPVAAVVTAGGCTEADAITDGTVTNPTFDNPGGCYGVATTVYGTGPNTFHTTTCVPTNCTGDVSANYTPAGGGASDQTDFTITRSGLVSFSTSLGTRLHPGGTTQFTLTATDPFPNSLLQVEFAGKTGSVFAQVNGNGVSPSVSGTGPVNHAFLGNVKRIFVTQLNPDGSVNTSVPLVLKAKNPGAYFALDRPTTITSVTPSSVPATGGTVTIAGSGFQTWQLTNGQDTLTVNPTVLVGESNEHDQITFTVITTTTPPSGPTTILGNVGPTPSTVKVCAQEGQTPCKTITVVNPGGSDGRDDLTSEKLLTVGNPSPPVIRGTAALSVARAAGPPTSNTLGLQNIRIEDGFTIASPVTARIIGDNFLRVQTVTFGPSPIPVGPSAISTDGKMIEVSVPSHCLLGTGVVDVKVFDDANQQATLTNGWSYTPTGPIGAILRNVAPQNLPIVVGPCEDVTLDFVNLFQPNDLAATDCNYTQASCVKITSVTPCQKCYGSSAVFPDANIALLQWGANCSGCTPATVSYAFKANLGNSKSMTKLTVCAVGSCSH
jgi:hypothetical protein